MFWKKSPIQKLQKQFDKLTEEAFLLSKTDRTKSDQKRAEAEAVAKEIEKLQKANG